MTQNGGASYTYDGENRIATTAGYTYTYDADGKRIKKASASNTTYYYYGRAPRCWPSAQVPG